MRGCGPELAAMSKHLLPMHLWDFFVVSSQVWLGEVPLLYRRETVGMDVRGSSKQPLSRIFAVFVPSLNVSLGHTCWCLFSAYRAGREGRVSTIRMGEGLA